MSTLSAGLPFGLLLSHTQTQWHSLSAPTATIADRPVRPSMWALRMRLESLAARRKGRPCSTDTARAVAVPLPRRCEPQ